VDRLGVHGVHAHIETVAQIAKVLLQRSLGGFTGLKAIRFSRRLAHGPPAFEAIAMVRHDLKHVDYRHIVSLSGMSGPRTFTAITGIGMDSLLDRDGHAPGASIAESPGA
jgi:hypothetical protein